MPVLHGPPPCSSDMRILLLLRNWQTVCFTAEDWGMRIRCDFEGNAAIACLRAEDFKLAGC